MATNTTNNYFSKPAVGGDTDTWGTTLNANWDAVDSIVTGGTSITRLGIGTTNSTLPLICNAASATDIAASFSGLVGIGTTTPDQKLQVDGNIRLGDTATGVDDDEDYGLITGGQLTIHANDSGDNINYTGLVFDVGNASGAEAASSRMLFRVNNTERMRIDSSGNVGIGTTSPDVALDIERTNATDNSNVPTLRFTDNDTSSLAGQKSGQIEFYSNDNNPNSAGVHSFINGQTENNSGYGALVLGTGQTGSSTERMRIDSSGKVGIGTDSPSFKTDINVNSTLANDTQVALRVKSTTTADMTNDFGVSQLFSVEDSSGTNFNIAQLRVVRDGADDSGAFAFAPYSTGIATERMRIDADGNVGIGTDSPADELHLNASKSGGDAVFRIQNSATTTGDSATLRFCVSEDVNHDSAFIGSDRSNSLIFGADLQERMRIDSSGNVGIGTASPITQLHVAGSAYFDGGASSTVTVMCNDGGTSTIKALGDNQGNGRVYVGQSNTFGGGIEYSGESDPVLSGAGDDHIALFRRNNGTNAWTARNQYGNNNWEFRGNVTAQGSFHGIGSIQYTDVSVYSNTDHDQQISWTLPSGAQVINAVVTTEGFDIAAVRQIRNSGCVINRYDHEGNQTINIRVWHTQI